MPFIRNKYCEILITYLLYRANEIKYINRRGVFRFKIILSALWLCINNIDRSEERRVGMIRGAR